MARIFCVRPAAFRSIRDDVSTGRRRGSVWHVAIAGCLAPVADPRQQPPGLDGHGRRSARILAAGFIGYASTTYIVCVKKVELSRSSSAPPHESRTDRPVSISESDPDAAGLLHARAASNAATTLFDLGRKLKGSPDQVQMQSKPRCTNLYSCPSLPEFRGRSASAVDVAVALLGTFRSDDNSLTRIRF
jgi:hypothetical protein